jgi:ATP-binding cassette subfamily B protein/ATP-binding cassette subfamily C protein/ATP-binding cassette subfamily B multidrug efflux pump
VREADGIVVLNHGRIAEQGRHEDLLAIEGGLYRRLWELQQLEEREDGDASDAPPVHAG